MGNGILEIINDKFHNYPNLFKAYSQIRENIEDYFKIKFSCKYFPYGFLEFINVYDGAELGEIKFYSITSDGKDKSPLLFKDYTNDEAVAEFTKNFAMGSNDSRILFFAQDDRGGRYFFKKDIQDDRVFYQNSNNTDAVMIWDGFYDLLLDIINNIISNA